MAEVNETSRITTWQQGRFINQPQYKHWSQYEKDKADKEERHFVRPSATGNAICHCPDPYDAIWVADRLNMAAILEQLTHDYATGKNSGSDIRNYVDRQLEKA